MASSLRVLFAASEAHPLTKTGGLADVAGALPAALRGLGVDVRVLLPGYAEVLRAIDDAKPIAALPSSGFFPRGELLSARTPDGQPLVVLVSSELYERDGGPYLDAAGRDWADNAVRFGFLSYVAALVASERSPIDWPCDIVHCNDWQTGLAPAYLHWWGAQHAPALMTLHNLAYQGIFAPSFVPRLGLPWQSFSIEGIEYHGRMSFLKAGIYYANRISTVSPTYAREIQSEPLGFGLHGLLAGRSDALDGILNGIDTEAWNSASDPALRANYDADSLPRKILNKAALRERFGLEPAPDVPLLGIVSRLIPQKGIDLVVGCAQRLLALPAQLIVLGTGDEAIERDLDALARSQPGRVAFVRGFDEALSHLIEAGADAFLMPSRFEPCGLNQMYSQRYGTPPVVRRTGGLADSVVDCTSTTLADGTATGFVYDAPTPDALLQAAGRAVAAWRSPQQWRRIQRNGMQRDFGWSASARRYLDLYRTMLATR
jgi:starch synthase